MPTPSLLDRTTLPTINRGLLAGFMMGLLAFAGALSFPSEGRGESPIPIAIMVELESFDSGNVGGDSADTLLWRRGHASTTGGVMRVVNNGSNRSGIVVRRNRVRLTDGFSTYFVMHLHGGTTSLPADGMTFIIQDNPEPIVGDSGGGVGYRGIPNSIGIEFDIWQNTGSEGGMQYYDPDADQVAIVINGDNSHAPANNDPIHTNAGLYGSELHVWVDYNVSSVTATWGPSPNRANSSNNTLTRTGDVGHLDGRDVFVGFGASTGGSNAHHDIRKWYFKDTYVPGGLSSAAGTYSQAASTVTVTLSPGSDNPETAAIRVLNASGDVMPNEDVEISLGSTSYGTHNTGSSGVHTFTIPELPVGSYTLGALAQGGATDDVAFTISKLSQSIDFPAISAREYGDAPFDPGATASSGLGVEYSSGNTDVATVSSGLIHIVGAGTAVITASQPGNATYHPADDVQRTLVAHPRPVVGGFTAVSKEYDDTVVAEVSGRTLSGVLAVDEGQVYLSGGDAAFEDKYVGTDKVVTLTGATLAGDRATHYSLESVETATADIVPGPPDSIAVLVQPDDGVAGEPNPAPPTVIVRDAYANPVAAGHPVEVSLAEGEATLWGRTTAATDENGTIVFDDLIIRDAGTGYRLDFQIVAPPETPER